MLALVVMLAAMLTGCGDDETAEQKIAAFEKAHGTIYDAWASTSTGELEERLGKGMVDPMLKEQMSQQSKVMQQRLMQNERHGVRKITYNKVEIVNSGSSEMTVNADWTVDGYIEHGDVHEQRVSYRKQFHCVKKDGVWKMDKMSDWK
jgi:hypothetical protein